MKSTDPLRLQRAQYIRALAEAVERIEEVLTRKPEVELVAPTPRGGGTSSPTSTCSW
jgi:hypothetical protein